MGCCCAEAGWGLKGGGPVSLLGDSGVDSSTSIEKLQRTARGSLSVQNDAFAPTTAALRATRAVPLAF